MPQTPQTASGMISLSFGGDGESVKRFEGEEGDSSG